VIELAREELRKRRPCRGTTGGSAGASRSDASASRRSSPWGDLTEAEYRRQKTEVERDLLPIPDGDRLAPFDRHRRLMVSMAENVAGATPEMLREPTLMLVERAETRDRRLGPDRWTGPARTSFAVAGVAPPGGSASAVLGLEMLPDKI